MSFDGEIAVSVSLDASSVGKTAFGTPLILVPLADGDYAITGIGVAPANTITIVGDHTAHFKDGDELRIYASTGNDGIYTCSGDAVFGAGNTTITTAEDIDDATVDGGVLIDEFLNFYKEYSLPSELSADQALFGVAADVDEIGYAFTQSPRPKTIAVGVWGSEHATIKDALDDLWELYQGFYGFAVKDATDADYVASPNTGTASLWAETNGRILFADSDDADIPGSAVEATSIAALAKAAGLEYTVVCYHPTPAEMLGWALCCKYFAFSPDSYATIAYCQTLTGVTAQSYTSGIQTIMDGKYANYYTTMGGVGAFGKGYTAKGRWLDVRVSADWAAARIREDLMQAFVNASNAGRRIPYTDAGFKILEGLTLVVLQRGEGVGHFIEGSSAVQMPALADVTPAQRTARSLTYEFGAQPSGAVQSVTVAGTVSVSFTAPTA